MAWKKRDKSKGFFPYVDEEISFFKQGIDRQREIFKYANQENQYDIMMKSLENIKNEIRSKAIRKGFIQRINNVEKIISWYKDLPMKYRKFNLDGSISYGFPENLEIKISKGLNYAYCWLTEILENLDLL